MVAGKAMVKEKSVKHLGGNKFEMTLTGVTPDDVYELLQLTGKPVHFKAMVDGGEEEPKQAWANAEHQGRLFVVDERGVANFPSRQAEKPEEVAAAPDPVEAGEEETTEDEGDVCWGAWICDHCGLHVGELEDPENTRCPECGEGQMVFSEVPDTATDEEQFAEEAGSVDELDEFPDISEVIMEEKAGDESLEDYPEPGMDPSFNGETTRHLEAVK